MPNAILVCNPRSASVRIPGEFLRQLFIVSTSALLFLCFPASAQSAPPSSPSWERVLQLAPASHLKVIADQNGGDCLLQSVSLEGLTCLHGNTTRMLPRAEIKSIKLAHRGRSATIGFGLGAGIGAALGAGVGSVINSSDSGNLLHVSGGKAAAVGAGVGLILGGATGALAGYASDLFATPTIYKR